MIISQVANFGNHHLHNIREKLCRRPVILILHATVNPRVGFIYILDTSNSNVEPFSSPLALEATKMVSQTVSQTVTQMAVELINIHLISVQQKR